MEISDLRSKIVKNNNTIKVYLLLLIISIGFVIYSFFKTTREYIDHDHGSRLVVEPIDNTNSLILFSSISLFSIFVLFFTNSKRIANRNRLEFLIKSEEENLNKKLEKRKYEEKERIT